MVFKFFCILVLWTTVASALEGFKTHMHSQNIIDPWASFVELTMVLTASLQPFDNLYAARLRSSAVVSLIVLKRRGRGSSPLLAGRLHWTLKRKQPALTAARVIATTQGLPATRPNGQYRHVPFTPASNVSKEVFRLPLLTGRARVMPYATKDKDFTRRTHGTSASSTCAALICAMSCKIALLNFTWPFTNYILVVSRNFLLIAFRADFFCDLSCNY